MNYLKIVIPQASQIYQIDFDQYLTPKKICQTIYEKLFPQNTISTNRTKLIFKNKELDSDMSIQVQGIMKQDELQFYYTQLIQINCLCDNQNFTLQVDYIKPIGNYMNIFYCKFKKQYQQYEIKILCKSGPHKQETLWCQTGITDKSQVDIQILLPVNFTFKHLRFLEYIPSTWKVHKIMTYIRGKKQINEIIQFNCFNKIIDHDLELYQLYPHIYDWQIEIIDEPQYLIKLNDGRSKIIKINSQEKISHLCQLIKSEFNINEDLILDLQYGQMKLIHQALIVDEMILNNSTIVITNQIVNYQDQQKYNSICKIILINKRNPSQIQTTTLQSSQSINNLDLFLIPQNKNNQFSIQYFQQEKQINENTIIQNLVQVKETEIKLEFTISKKTQIIKNIGSFDEIYKLKFKYLNQDYTHNVIITKTLKQIEEDLRKKYSIPQEYSIFLDNSYNQSKSIVDLQIQSLNIIFEFKKVDLISFEILIHPIHQKLQLQTSKENTVMWLRETIQKKFLKENDQARIQIKLNQNLLQDDQYLYKELQMNNKNQIEAFILNKFQIQFQDSNKQILTDDVYEDYYIKDSVICLGLQDSDFFINNTQIDTNKSFQFYNINEKNQIIEYIKTYSGIYQLKEPSIQIPLNFTTQLRQKQNKQQNLDQYKQF